MKEFKYIIKDLSGIHARPAGELVQTAKRFESEINIEANGKTADAKKIFSVMGLAAKQGHELAVTVNGTDEETAADTLETFLKNNL